MINLTLVNNENTQGLFAEYNKHYGIQLNDLSSYHQDIYQIITETTMGSYFFPYNSYPWQKEYGGSVDFLDVNGNHVHLTEVKKHVTASQRRERTTWLMDYAFNQMISRAQDVLVGICDPWANVITSVLFSTYKAMALQHPRHLVSYRQLVTPVNQGGLGVVGRAKAKTLRNKWSEPTFQRKLADNVWREDNPYAPIKDIYSRDMPEFGGDLDNQRRFFYTRVNARAAFCCKAIMWKAHSIAQSRLHSRDHWIDQMKYWEETLGHGTEVIEYIYEHHKKSDSDSLRWILNLTSSDALMPTSHDIGPGPH